MSLRDVRRRSCNQGTGNDLHIPRALYIERKSADPVKFSIVAAFKWRHRAAIFGGGAVF